MLAATTLIRFGERANVSVAVGKTQAQVPVPAMDGKTVNQTANI